MATQSSTSTQPQATQVAPLAPAELEALLTRRRELSSQLNSAIERRGSLARAMDRAPSEARSGYLEQIKLLDERILQLERDLAEASQQIASPAATMARVLQPETVPGPVSGMSEDAFIAVSSVFTIFVLAPIAIAVARTLWRRASAVTPQVPVQLESRLERMEQALDAISIEVERVAEAQRFQSRLLAQAAEERGILGRAGELERSEDQAARAANREMG